MHGLSIEFRRWLVVFEHRQRNQRHLPRMALIRPSFTETGLQVEAPGMAPLLIPYSPLPEDIIEIEFVTTECCICRSIDDVVCCLEK